jgi:hypothetical protein
VKQPSSLLMLVNSSQLKPSPSSLTFSRFH